MQEQVMQTGLWENVNCERGVTVAEQEMKPVSTIHRK